MGPSFLQNAIDLLDQGQTADAIRALRPLTQRFPNYPSPFILLARAYEAEGNWKAATATWQHVNGLVAESPVVTAGMKRGRARLAQHTLQTQPPAANVTPAEEPSAPRRPAAARGWEWPEGLINEYADLHDPTPDLPQTPSTMPDSPVVKKLLARLGDTEPSARTAPSLSDDAAKPAEQEANPTPEPSSATDSHDPAPPHEVDNAPVEADAGSPLEEPGSSTHVVTPPEPEVAAPSDPHEATEDAPPTSPSRANQLTALLDALDTPDEADPPSSMAPASDHATLAFDTPNEDDADAPKPAVLFGEPEPETPAEDASDPLAELDAVFEQADAAAEGTEADEESQPTAEDLASDYDDLDALIESLEGARIRPRPDLDEIPPPDLDDDIDDMVSETLARIYAGQRKYEEAARVYEKLAEQQPERATEFTEKAALIRSRTS